MVPKVTPETISYPRAKNHTEKKNTSNLFTVIWKKAVVPI